MRTRNQLIFPKKKLFATFVRVCVYSIGRAREVRVHNVNRLNHIDKFVSGCCDSFYVSERVWEVGNALFHSFVISYSSWKLFCSLFLLALLFNLFEKFSMVCFLYYTKLHRSFVVYKFQMDELKTATSIFIWFAFKLNSNSWFFHKYIFFSSFFSRRKHICDCELIQSKGKTDINWNVYIFHGSNKKMKLAHRNWK